MNYTRPSKKAIGCMYVSSGIWDIIIFVAALFLKIYVIPERMKVLHILVMIVMILCVLDLLIFPYLRYLRYAYCITEEYIDVKEGFFFIEENIVPLERLHKIRTLRGPVDRMFGLTKVIVTTAGGDVTIRFLEEAQAQEIAMTLQKKINQITKQQREE